MPLWGNSWSVENRLRQGGCARGHSRILRGRSTAIRNTTFGHLGAQFGERCDSVRYEVLAGARTDESLLRWERDLRSMALIIPATVEDHAMAGQLASFCRRRGVPTGARDVLMAAQALFLGASIFAEDADYAHIQSVLPLLNLHRPGDVPAEVAEGG